MSKKPKRKSITATTEDGSPVIEVYSLKCEGNNLVIDGLALDSMRMNVILNIDELAQGMNLVLKKDVLKFAIQLPKAIMRYRKKKKAEEKSAP